MLSLWLAAVFAVVASMPAPSPSLSPSPSPSPHASSSPIAEIGRVESGRGTNLVGTAAAASEGTIDQQEIATQPLLRPADLLEQIPGLIISQHSGEGKANQYYLRGFQLDHGTDLASFIDGVPINMPTHAHGQGYSDINWLIPELVGFVTFKKGPYYADEGDFSTAGAYELSYKNTVAPILSLGGGTYGYGRFLALGAPQIGPGTLLYAFELYHDDGSFQRGDDYKKINGVLRWSQTSGPSSYTVTAQGYRGDFNSSDQIPLRLVDAGQLNRFGLIDPTDGGRTYRYSLSAQYHHVDPNGYTDANVYGLSYKLQLYSNFTYDLDDATDYYNVTANPVTCNVLYSTCTPGAQHLTTYTSYCPANVTPTGAATTPGAVTPKPFVFGCGDQREQEDIRFVSGFQASRVLTTGHATSTFGIGSRNDNISTVGLFLTTAQNPLPGGTLSDDHVVERDSFLWAQTEYDLGSRLRLIGGLRGEYLTDNVAAYLPQNSGQTHGGLLLPKVQAAYAFNRSNEAYLDFGESFHSNDGRGTTQTVDPQTHATIDPSGAPVIQYAPLVRASGEELGYRYSNSAYTATVALWRLDIASELVFDGDSGVTTPNGPTRRYGLELTNFWHPVPSVTVDVDYATSAARFLTDPAGLGTYVPESLNIVSAAGVTWDRPHFAASLRLEYFGPRVLDQAGDAVSAPSSTLGTQISWKLPHAAHLSLDVFNLLNSQSDDVEYYYGSWLPQDAANPAYANNPAINPALGGAGVNDYHVHPSEARTFRLTYVFRP